MGPLGEGCKRMLGYEGVTRKLHNTSHKELCRDYFDQESLAIRASAIRLMGLGKRANLDNSGDHGNYMGLESRE